MKLAINILIVIIFFLNNISLYAKNSPVTPRRLEIVGGIIGGIELINGLLQLFRGEKEDEKAKFDIKKQEEIDRLLSGSRLLAVLNEKNNYYQTKEKSTNEKITQETYEKEIASVNKKSNNIIETSEKASKPLKNKVAIIPSEQEEHFTYKITNYTYNKSTYLKRGTVDYYEVGIAYYNVGKKEKAKEYLLHTIAIGVRKEEAIDFLIKNYNMRRREIQIEKKKYKRLK